MTTRLSSTFRTAAISFLSGQYGNLEIRTGTQPATGDTAPSGTLLVTIPMVYFTPGTAGVQIVDSGYAPYQALAVAAGTAGWGRLTFSDGSSIDGAVATSGQQFNISATAIAVNDTVVLNSCNITQPA